MLYQREELPVRDQECHDDEKSTLQLLGLFTIAILGPFSGHFQTHFWAIFEYLAEEQKQKGTKNGMQNDVKNVYCERSGKENLEKWWENAFFSRHSAKKLKNDRKMDHFL